MTAATMTIHATAVLRRRAIAEDLGFRNDADGDAYWAAAPRLYDFSKHHLKQEGDHAHPMTEHDPAPRADTLPPAPPPPSPSPPRRGPSAHLSLLALHGTGLAWGVRKRVRYVARHRGAPPALGVVVKSENTAHGDEEKKAKRRRRKPAAPPKVEVSEEAGARVVTAADDEAEAEAEGERKVSTTDQGKMKRKDVRRRGRPVAKRHKKANLLVPEDEAKVVNKTEERNLLAEQTRTGTAVMPEKKRGLPEEERTAVVAVKRERKSKIPLLARRVMEAMEMEEPETKPAPAVKAEEATALGVPRGMVDRWTSTRYAAAEASLVGVLRGFGARADKPVPRGELRAEARKLIGDTGLLDHLLKHAADKVPRGSAERLRRRHTADGAMEYWLEPAELAALRREVGVVDPYWVPPRGWKRGDPVSADGYALKAQRQVEELAAELAGVKRHLEQFMKAHQGAVNIEMKSKAVKDYIFHEPCQEKYECVQKANDNLENRAMSLEEKYACATLANAKLEEKVLLLKEKYEAVLERNSRLEEQMAALATSLLSPKEGVQFLNGGEPEHGDRLLLRAKEKESREADRQESNGGSEAPGYTALVVGAGDHLCDVPDDGGGKRSPRKCIVRICSKPQGALQWPDAAQPSSPLPPTAARVASVDDDDEQAIAGALELPPTPPSARSTNAASSAELLPLHAPVPPSTVQPHAHPPTAGSPRVDAGSLDLQLRHTAQDASLPFPRGATVGLPEGNATGGAGGGTVGGALALVTPSY